MPHTTQGNGKADVTGNLARSMPMPAIKDGDKSQKESKAAAEVPATTVQPVATDGEELYEDPETGEIVVRKIEAAAAVTAGSATITPEVEKTAIERLITGYYFEDDPAVKESSRKPRKPGEPTIYTLRAARCHWKVGNDGYELMTSSISRQRKVWSHVEGEGAAAKLVVDREERKIVISAPGCMVGDDTWVPALTRGGGKNRNRQADPEFAALRERVKNEWMNERRARVKAGEIVAGHAINTDSAAMTEEQLTDLGLL